MTSTTDSRCPNCGHRLGPGQLLSTRDAAALISETLGATSPRTLEAWRRTWLPGRPVDRRRGPEPLAMESGEIRYGKHDVLAWLTDQVDTARARNASG